MLAATERYAIASAVHSVRSIWLNFGNLTQLVCISSARSCEDLLFYLFNGQLFKRMPVLCISLGFNEISPDKNTIALTVI